MLVTPARKNFGRYKPGDVFELRDKAAKVLIKLGKLTGASAPANPQTYMTRVMRAAPAPVVLETREVVEPPVVADESNETAPDEAPYGYKADGTPRKRPGRPASET